jgi:hypothetical protein
MTRPAAASTSVSAEPATSTDLVVSVMFSVRPEIAVPVSGLIAW